MIPDYPSVPAALKQSTSTSLPSAVTKSLPSHFLVQTESPMISTSTIFAFDLGSHRRLVLS
jgi:hypothetical protein